MKRAFTLIEILIVILIIGTLTTIAIPMLKGMAIKAKLAGMYIEVEQIEKAIDMYSHENPGWFDTFTDSGVYNDVCNNPEFMPDFLRGYDYPLRNPDFQYDLGMGTEMDGRRHITIYVITRNVMVGSHTTPSWNAALCERHIMSDNTRSWTRGGHSPLHPWKDYLVLPT